MPLLLPPEGLFPDVRVINYADLTVRRLFIDLVWKPFVLRYIRDYRFTGVRLDAVKHIEAAVLEEISQYVRDVCLTVHEVEPIILGEYIAGNPDDVAGEINNLIGVGITHIYNSLFYKTFFSHVTANEGADRYQDDDAAHLVHLRQAIQPPDSGGTLAFTGNHDFGTSFQKLFDIFKGPEHQHANPPTEIELKERLWAISLTSDAGYYMLCGDEFGAQRRLHVFAQRPTDYPYYRGPQSQPNTRWNTRWGGNYDFTGIVKQINQILDGLEQPLPTTFVFHDYFCLDDGSNVDLIVRQRAEHNWQGVDIFVFDIKPDSQLNHENSGAILQAIERRLSQNFRNANANWYLVKGDRAYRLKDNQFQLVMPNLFPQSQRYRQNH